MAEPGDPKGPQGGADHDHDAEVGFCTPQSLTGRPVEPPAPEAEPESVSEPEFEPEAAAETEATPDLFAPPEPAPVAPEPAPPPPSEPKAAGPFERTIAATPGLEARFAADRARMAGAAPAQTFGRAAPPPPLPMGLYAVYVLILLAVPTLGVSVLIALLAVLRREPPEEPLAASHFVYQQRTLWASVIAAALGAILVIVNVGVFVLFVLAVWVLARGAYGVLRLKSGRPISNPRAWLF